MMRRGQGQDAGSRADIRDALTREIENVDRVRELFVAEEKRGGNTVGRTRRRKPAALFVRRRDIGIIPKPRWLTILRRMGDGCQYKAERRLRWMGTLRSRRQIFVCVCGLVLAVVFAMSIADSFRFDPDSSIDATFLSRASRAATAGLKVSISALGAEESRRAFGAPLAKYGIQPVWLSVDNDTDESFTYLPIATDRDYFSPYEVSYRTHGLFSIAANRERDAFFLAKQIPIVAPPHTKISGFVFGQLDAGEKYAQVWLSSPSRLEKFAFALDVPGPAFLGEKVDRKDLYPDQPLVDLDLPGLRAALEKAPCCTSNANASKLGDPVNLVVVESEKGLLTSFVERGWHLTQKLDIASSIETARAFLFRDAFETSPVSPLYLFGRREDLALQKARSTINERIHLRLWLSPETFSGRRVWMGGISRDIGVELTDKVWNLTTHKIGPDVDFDRGYLLQDLLMSGFVERFGFVQGVGAAPMSAPRANLTDDPYFTDGLRLVIFLSPRARALAELDVLSWEKRPSLSDEGH